MTPIGVISSLSAALRMVFSVLGGNMNGLGVVVAVGVVGSSSSVSDASPMSVGRVSRGTSILEAISFSAVLDSSARAPSFFFCGFSSISGCCDGCSSSFKPIFEDDENQFRRLVLYSINDNAAITIDMPIKAICTLSACYCSRSRSVSDLAGQQNKHDKLWRT